jgi:tetratricopeptide (TPR) repeat protein
MSLTLAYSYAHDYDQALQQAQKTVELYPTHSHALRWLGYTYERKKNYEQAMEQWIKLAEMRGDKKYATEIMHAFEKSGYSGYLVKDAKDSEAGDDYTGAAADFAMLGDRNAAFAALEKAFVSRRPDMLFLKVEPLFDNLHSDPRFADLLRRMGLPQ